MFKLIGQKNKIENSYLRYIIIGWLSFSVDITILNFLYTYINLDFTISFILGFICWTLISFSWAGYVFALNWKKWINTRNIFFFIIIQISWLFLSEYFLTIFFLYVIWMYYLFAKTFSVALIFSLNFYLKKKLFYKNKI